MEISFYILTEEGTAKSVTEGEHEAWGNLNAVKFNKVWQTEDGVKKAYLRFVGEKKKGERLNLFEVETIFQTYDGEIVNRFETPFATYKKALEAFEDYVFLNGGRLS